MLLHLFVTPLPYNAVAARGLLGRTDKNIVCHFLANEVAVYFYNKLLRNIKQSKSFPGKVGEYPPKP